MYFFRQPRMQGKQMMANLERKGPHKSMHCKFCKPPGVVTPEKPSRAQLETKTKIHLTHEAADLRLCNIHDEPGFPAVESEACVCILEGENPCPKCVPDKTRPTPKKKVCTCPKGAKPHPSMYNVTTVKKKKQKEEDDEFWWEKYSREHDAIAKETWSAYMAHRRKERKLAKCQNRENLIVKKKGKRCPDWYQKLSCQQMIYVEFLSTAIRLDSDENITDRTYFVLGGIGLYPRPQKKLLKRCLRYCHYNSIQFLNQLHMLTKDEDPFQERWKRKSAGNLYTWNDRLIMSCICYLEFPALLREIMERLPPLPRKPILPQIPYPDLSPSDISRSEKNSHSGLSNFISDEEVRPILGRMKSKIIKRKEFPAPVIKKYDNPYEEPVWRERLNWVEKMKIDRLNRCRAHMETKRVKIPFLALMRRPSLIDARPPFLAQIEANERASRRLVVEKEKKPPRKHPISTFNSAVDVTAIAGIEASEISTTDKADTDDICVFLRDPKEAESMAGELEEEPDFLLEKEVRFLEEPFKSEETQINHIKCFYGSEENSEEEEREAEDIPFKNPPKTESGATIASPCPPPDATPGPPATHFEKGKRELDIINEEICGFTPFVASSTQTVKNDISDREDDVELKLKSAAAKLKEFAEGHDERDKQPQKKKQKKCKKKEKCKKRKSKRKGKLIKNKKIAVVEMSNLTEIDSNNNDEEEDDDENDILDDMDEDEEDEMKISYKIERERDLGGSKRDSEISDPDPDTDGEWSTRPPCTPEANRLDEGKKPTGRPRKLKRKGKTQKRKPRRKKGSNGEKRVMELKEEKGEYLKKKKTEMRLEKETMTESASFNKEKRVGEKEAAIEEKEPPVRDEFRGNVDPLVQKIIKDLEEEGFYCASFPNINQHPDIYQLISHLKGKILNKALRESLQAKTKYKWTKMERIQKFHIPEFTLSPKKMLLVDWNDKKWLSRLAKKKLDQFYYKIANSRAQFGQELYNTLYQDYLGTDRYLKIFYAYMTSKYEDDILRGIV